MKFVELNKKLQEGIEPVYLIEGEETYFREHAVKSIQTACGISQPMLNDVREEGENLKGDRLVSFKASLYSLPFLDERRLVRVYDFYPSEREWESVLGTYAENPCPSTVLLIVNSGKKANSAELKKKKGVTLVDCSRSDEETLTRWLYSLLRREGLNADADAAGLMVHYCASDAARMKKEAEKLKLLLGEGGKVTRETIEEHIERDAEYKIYELTQAASRGNFTAFSEILYDLMNKGYDENAALASLTAHFKTLTEVVNMRGSDAEIGKVLGIKPYAVQKNRELAQRLGKERTEELYRGLYTLSCGMRSGLYNKQNALFAAIAKIFFHESKNIE